MSKGFASNYRIVLLATGLFAAFGALGVRLVWLHVIDREALLKTITETRHQLIVEPAKRGDIRDRNGGILATSHSMIVLGVDPHSLLAKEWRKWPQLAALIDIPLEDLRQLFIPKYRDPAPTAVVPAESALLVFNLAAPGAPVAPPAAVPAVEPAFTFEDDSVAEAVPDKSGRKKIRWVKLREDVSEQLYARIRKLDIAGIRGERVYRRSYPSNQLASHVVGYVNRVQQPVTGIEAHANFYLRGQDGWRVGERDGRNRELAQFNTRKIAPSDGYTVFLTIDTIVQDIVEQELAYIAQKFEPLKATIIVSDPQKGFILGLGNYPTFDPNEYNKVSAEEMERMKNVAVADIYDPGSVFKIVPAAGALEERLVRPTTRFDCTLDKAIHRGRPVSLPAEDHRMGDLTVSEIISRSSNKGAAQLGMLLGEDKLYHYARAFGFGAKLGFPGYDEVSGILKNPNDPDPKKRWYPIDITRIPMGHSISSTVLQMHQAMSVIAADGMLLRPQIIHAIRDAAGDVDYKFGPEEIGRAISPATARMVATMLMGVAREGGTAAEAAIPGFDVAGKTGTSQKFINGEWSKKHHIASFVGFFPAHVAPGERQVAISVIVDDADHKAPNGVAYGRTVAAPSFKRIGERLIPILNINQSKPAVSPGLIAANDGGRR